MDRQSNSQMYGRSLNSFPVLLVKVMRPRGRWTRTLMGKADADQAFIR
jgi:hypothetical protein